MGEEEREAPQAEPSYEPPAVEDLETDGGSGPAVTS